MGTAGPGGPPGRAHNCVLLETASARLVLDFGEACSWRLAELGLTLCDVDAVYVSHGHADHYVGLFDAAVHSLASGCRRLRLALPRPLAAELLELVSSLLPSGLRGEVSVLGVGEEPVRVGDLEVAAAPSCHAVPCYGAVVRSGGSVVAYTADTRPCDGLYRALLRLGRPDLVIHEAALPDHLEGVAAEKGHSTPSAAARAAGELGAGLVALVHLSEASLRQLLRAARLPGRVLVPSDMAAVSL